MNRAQPQYAIRANRQCKTHPPGTELVYTGPRSGIGPGWNVIGRNYQWLPGGST